MARFDVYRLRGGLALDCQADMLSRMPSRFVVPLEPPHPSLLVDDVLNPHFEISEQRLIMVTQLAGTVRSTELKSSIGSLTDDRDQNAVQRALDLLMTGI